MELPKRYYDEQRDPHWSAGWHLDLMYLALKEIKLPRNALFELKRKNEISFLVLGSSSEKNISYVRYIGEYLRGKKLSNDSVLFIDTNRYPMELHRDEIRNINGWHSDDKRRTIPKFFVAQADMKAMPFQDSSMSVIISDHTLNYVSSSADIDTTLSEVVRVLDPEGIVLVSVEALEDESGQRTGQKHIIGGISVKKFPLSVYLGSAEKNGLRLVDMVGYKGLVQCAVFTKASFKNKKPE